MKKQVTAAALLTVLLLSSCGGETAKTVDTGSVNTAENETATAETEAVYPGTLTDFGGYEFTFYNQDDDFWEGSHHILDYAEETGDSVEDAVYRRNRQAENDLNIKIKVEKADLNDMYGVVNKTIAAGDDIYDAIYLPLNFSGKTSFGASWVTNLKSISTLQLDQPWWNQTFVEAATIGEDVLYTSIDLVNLMGYCYSNVLFFNKDMIRNVGLDQPYDLVRNNTWTYDTMYSYMKEVIDIGNQSNWKADGTGTAVYGLAVQHEEGPITLLQGCGSFLIEKDDNNMPVLCEDLTSVVNAYDKLTSILSGDGVVVMYNTAELSGKSIFLQGRSMFYQGSLGSATSDEFRNSTFEYGILPTPKYDDAQESYYTNVSQYTFALNIPTIAENPERTGTIIDYLAYLSYNDVVPVLQDALCYKGLRDEDSLDMLDILMNTQTIDFGVCAGLTYSFLSSSVTKMLNGKSEFMSLYEKNSKTIQKSIDKLFTENG